VKLDLREELDSAILARVAIQLVRIEFNRRQSPHLPPASYPRFVAAALPVGGFGMLRFAVHSLAVWVEQGYRSQDWVIGVGYRSAMGGNFRWHFFEGYKENRRATPRVTNRGGHPLASPSDLGKEGRVNNG